jgi:integrase
MEMKMKNREQIIFDNDRQMVRGRFFEMKILGKKHAPMHNLCTFDKYYCRQNGRKRTEREQINLLAQLYQEKLAKLKAIEERLAEETKILTEGIPIRTAMQQWIDNDIFHYTKPITAKEYMRTCTLYLQVVGDHSIKEFRKHHATLFQSGLKNIALSDAGIRKHQTHLQIFLNWAYSEEHLGKPVRLNKVRVMQQGPVIYARSEVEILQSTIEKALSNASTSYQKRCVRNHMRAFMAARYTVLRCGEIHTIPLRHVLLDEGVMRITSVPEIGWVPKTRQERVVPINPELSSFLETDRQNRGQDERWLLDDGLGGQAYASNSQLSQVFRRYTKRAGLEQCGRKPLHALRSTGITGMLSAGGKLDYVMTIAGHSNPQTTLNHYVRAENFDLRSTVNLLSSPPENGFIGER